jgi:hypothetical protein
MEESTSFSSGKLSMDVKKNDSYLLHEELAHDGKIQRNIIMLTSRQLRTSERNIFHQS